MIRHRHHPRWRVLVPARALLFASIIAGAGAAAAKSTPGLDARALFGFGHDSNSHREAVTADAGYYLPYDLRARYAPAVGKGSRLEFSAEADGQMYMGAVADGSESSFDFGVEYSRALRGTPGRRERGFLLDVGVYGVAAAKRDAYVSRLSGEEYTVDVAGIPVSLRDRFDKNDAVVGGRLGMRWPSTTQWAATLDVRHRNYTQDYDALPDVDRLDNRNLEASVQLTQEVARPVRLQVQYAHEVTDYYDRAVRDLSGERVAGVAQTFSFNTVRAGVRCELGKAWRVGLDSSWRARQDHYLGYYDAREWSIGPDIRFDATRRLGLRANYEYSHRGYERAHVSFDPDLPVRDDREHHLLLEGNYRLDPRSSFFLALEHDDVDEMNPAYSYGRTRAAAGYELRY